MKEHEEEEEAAEKIDRFMEWAARGTGKKYEPQSKKWKSAISQTKRRGGKKTRKSKPITKVENITESNLYSSNFETMLPLFLILFLG
jgi:hypothetical protein